VDKALFEWLKALLGPARTDSVSSNAWLETLASWEAEKARVGSAAGTAEADAVDHVSLSFGGIIVSSEENGGDLAAAALAAIVAEYNTRHALAGPAAVAFSRTDRRLVLPAAIVRAMYQPVVDETVALVAAALRASDAAALRDADRISHIIVAGGFAESPLLRAALCGAFDSSMGGPAMPGGGRRTVVLPRAPRKAVVVGAVAYGLQRLTTGR